MDAIKFSLQQSENQRLEIRKFEDVVRLPVSMDVASTVGVAEVNKCRINHHVLFALFQKVLLMKKKIE